MLQPGTLINQRYQIIRQVGQGGFGFVYEAFDTRLAKTVALKQTRFTDAQRKQALEHEAQLLAQLKHAGLPPVTDHFSDADGQFLVMEFIPGDDLATKLQQRGGPFPLAQVLQWADQLLEILAYLHNHQPPVCHYDIKPGNLKLTPDGSLMLLDFGLAKSSDSRASGYSDGYSPIEQVAGIGTDARSDLYAVGATLYHLLVGMPPPNAPTRSIAVHQNGKPDPLRPPHSANPAIPLAVSAALVQALAIRPADRLASATVLRAMLRDTSLPSIISTPVMPVMPVGTPSVKSKPPTIVMPVGTPSVKSKPPTIVELLAEVASRWRKGLQALIRNRTPTPLSHSPEIVSVSQPGVPNAPVVCGSVPTIHLMESKPSPNSSGVLPRHPEIVQPGEDHTFEDLILHRDYERIWRTFAYASGGRYVLTGYGPFGATSLIRCAVEKARSVLQVKMSRHTAHQIAD